MMKMTQEERRAEWAAPLDVVRFQEKLNAETDDGRYKILKQLLADEFGKFKKDPLLWSIMAFQLGCGGERHDTVARPPSAAWHHFNGTVVSKTPPIRDSSIWLAVERVSNGSGTRENGFSRFSHIPPPLNEPARLAIRCRNATRDA